MLGASWASVEIVKVPATYVCTYERESEDLSGHKAMGLCIVALRMPVNQFG